MKKQLVWLITLIVTTMMGCGSNLSQKDKLSSKPYYPESVTECNAYIPFVPAVDGVKNTIKNTISNSREFNPGMGYLVKYIIVDYSNGDSFVSCALAQDVFTASMTQYYSKSDPAIKDRGCDLVLDDIDDEPTGGLWSFYKTPENSYRLLYNDPHGLSINNGKEFILDQFDPQQGTCKTK